MPYQTSYPANIAAGYPGMIANMEPSFVVSRIVETAPMNWGAIAVQGANDKGITAPSATLGTAISAAKSGGNTGNGTLVVDATTPVLAGAVQGVYTAVVTTAGTNSATFTVSDPQGAQIGTVSFNGSGASSTFANQIKFAVTDGATDFVVGDAFNITVTLTGGSRYLGVIVRDQATDPNTPDQLAVGATAGVMTKGVIFVTAGEPVNAGDAAYYNPTTGAILKTRAGNIAIPRSRFDASAASGALVPLRIA